MAKKGKKARTPKKKDNMYKMPPPIPPGEVIHLKNRKWKIGPSIGTGGFGEIYSSCEFREDASTPNDVSSYPYVVKIEPIENGPLFVEMHFYNRNFNRDDIQRFMESRNLAQLGMPTYCGSGSHTFQNVELRFLILERYGTDLWKKFKEVGRKFPAPTVFQLGLQMLDVLDYIHSRSYIHADIKGANILMGIKKGTENQAYLLDFGLAYRIVGDNYKPDRDSAHEGTIEYTSTDRHVGAKTMRGDLEILGYNLLQWLVGELPWETVLEDQKKVHKMKSDFMSSVRTRITTDYPNVPDELIRFFEYIKTLEPADKPDYTICRQIFESFLTSVGKSRNSKLEFTTTKDNKQPTTTDVFPSSPNGVSISERAEIDNENVLEEQDAANMNLVAEVPKVKVRNKTKPKANKDKNPQIITISRSDSESKLFDNKEEKVTQNKKTKRKREKNPEDTPPTENDTESEQLEDDQKDKITKNKKKKRDMDHEVQPAENETESEKPDDNQEKKDKKNKRNKTKTDKDLEFTASVENDPQNEQLDDNQEKTVRNKKKNKRDKDTEVTESAENDPESEQLDDYQEEKIAKTKKRKKDKDHEEQPAENETESEQPDHNQEKKNKKNKRNKTKTDKDLEFTASVENDPQNEQLDDNQEMKVRKKKKNKRDKDTEVIESAENDPETEQLDDYQEEKIAKTKKRKKDKNLKVMPPAENDAETEQLDYQDQEPKKSKRNKRNRDKKTETKYKTENEQPAKKKRKSSEVTTPKKRNKNKLKVNLESDSENEFLDSILREKKKKKTQSFTAAELDKPKFPRVKADNNNTTSVRTLRSSGKDTRYYYKE